MRKRVKGVLSGIGVLVGLTAVLAIVTTLNERNAKASQFEQEKAWPEQAVRIVATMRNCLDVGDSTARTAGEKDQLYRQCWNRAELIGKKKP